MQHFDEEIAGKLQYYFGRARWAGRVIAGAWVAGVSEDVAFLVAPGSREILIGHNSKNGVRRKCISDLWADGISRLWKTLTIEARFIFDGQFPPQVLPFVPPTRARALNAPE